MRVVSITGCSGYIGTRLLDLLEEDPEVKRVVGLDLRAPSPGLKGGRRWGKPSFHRQDVSRPFTDIFVREGVSAAVHLAFYLSPIHDEARMEAVNIGGTRNFLDACAKAAVKRVVVLSSATAYGAFADNPERLTEEDPIRGERNDYAYARDKARVEVLCREFADSRPEVALAVARPSIVAGPRMDNFISRIFERPLVLTIKGYDPPLQVVHEEDVSRAIHLMLQRGARGAFNLGADDAVSADEMSELGAKRRVELPYWLMAAIAGLGWKLRLKKVSELPPSFLDFARYPWVVANDKVKRELGFEFRYTTRAAIEDYLRSKG